MDLIDRQAAIDALAKFVPYAICDESTESYTNGLTDAYNLICQLPSAQPIVRCCDCKHHWIYRCMDSMPMEKCDLEQTFYDANVDYCSLAERRTDG